MGWSRGSGPFFDLDDLVGQEAVGLAVNGGCRLLAGRLDATEPLARPLVVPVSEIVHPVLVLDAQIGLVGAGDGRARQSIDLLVNVEIKRHDSSPSNSFHVREANSPPNSRNPPIVEARDPVMQRENWLAPRRNADGHANAW